MNLSENIVKRAVKKAIQSDCRYRISAIGLNKKGEVFCSVTNRQRFYYKGGGKHAEMLLMETAGKGLKTIIICRVGLSNSILPIKPCPMCNAKADELGIKIISVESSR